MEETIMIALDYIIRAVIIILGPMLIAFVQSKFSENQLQKIKKWAEVGVEAAEQLFFEGEDIKKKGYVSNFLMEKLNSTHFINLSDKELNALIEAAVYEVKKINKG